jgi:hypothetical protein
MAGAAYFAMIERGSSGGKFIGDDSGAFATDATFGSAMVGEAWVWARCVEVFDLEQVED